MSDDEEEELGHLESTPGSEMNPPAGDERRRRRWKLKLELELAIWLNGEKYELVATADRQAQMDGARTSSASAKTQEGSQQRQRPTATSEERMRARLREARRVAGITQSELAERLGLSRCTVANAETGRGRVGKRYLGLVLSACGIASHSEGRGERTDGGRVASGAESSEEEELPVDWVRRRRYCVGIDPETCEPVRRGSPRDLELRETFPRWALWADIETYG